MVSWSPLARLTEEKELPATITPSLLPAQVSPLAAAVNSPALWTPVWPAPLAVNCSVIVQVSVFAVCAKAPCDLARPSPVISADVVPPSVVEIHVSDRAVPLLLVLKPI